MKLVQNNLKMIRCKISAGRKKAFSNFTAEQPQIQNLILIHSKIQF